MCLLQLVDILSTLLEDSFIKFYFRLEVPSLSIAEDNIGIYNDKCSASRLESLFNLYEFNSDY